MANNSAMFYQQQKKGFYSNQFEKLTPEELERMVGKYKAKKPPVFPEPKIIFLKHFRFLNGTLGEFLRAKKQEVKTLELPKQNEAAKIEEKKVTKPIKIP